MKKISQKNLNRLKELQGLKKTLIEEHKKRSKQLQKEYNISDKHFNYNYEEWTENDYDFNYAWAELNDEFEHKKTIIDAKWAAKFLIATNIARKGKLLHPDIAIQKLKKYGDKGKYIIDMINMPILPMVCNSEPYLACELHNTFNVTLMNTYLLKDLLTKIHNHTHIFPDEYQKKRFKRYQNFIKKFHKSVIEYQKTLSHEPF